MGAFFFVRSLLTFVNDQAPFRGNAVGWTLTALFFFDAWLLGEFYLLVPFCLFFSCVHKAARQLREQIEQAQHT
jgi:hypothetical protein